jgi:AcrR family transcriptional regulator
VAPEAATEAAAGTSDRKDATRERLLKAARELFVTRGYHATRPQDVAKLAGLGQGTFYLYFSDKKACFVAFVAQARLELQQYVGERVFGVVGLEAFFAAQIGATLDFSVAHPGLLRAAMVDVSTIATDAPDLSQTWASAWARMVANTMQRGAIDPSYDAEIVGALLVGTIGGAVAAENHGAPRDKVIANTVRFLMRALRPER